MRDMLRGLRGRDRGRRPVPLTVRGLTLLLVLLALVLGAINKDRLAATINLGGESLQAEFARDYQVEPYKSDVKLSGVVVGVVTDVEPTDRGTYVVTMDLHDDVLAKLGSAPTAKIRPTLLLGGNYYVDLRPGGAGDYPGGRIPLDRTSVPVELGRVLSTFTPPAKQGLQTAITQTDSTLRAGGKEALVRVLRHAPATLKTGSSVLHAMRGAHPRTDLTNVVRGLQSTADGLIHREGQLGSITRSLAATGSGLSAEREPLTQAVATAPDTLNTARAGLRDLRPTLRELETTARHLLPTARQLEPLLTNLQPVLARTQPVLQNARPLLRDLQPVVERLVPTSTKTTAVFQDVQGKVLNRLNGPITRAILERWTGHGPYEGGGGTGHRTYEELGYLASNGAGVFQYHDQTGTLTRLATGVGGNSVGGSGFPMSLEQYLERFGIHRPKGPQDNAQAHSGPSDSLVPQPGRGTVGAWPQLLLPQHAGE